MNRRQLIAMWIGIGIAVAMCILPPWIETTQVHEFGQMSRPGGYHLISSWTTSPPGIHRSEDLPRAAYVAGGEIDVLRLVVQEAAVIVLFGGLLISLNDRRKGS